MNHPQTTSHDAHDRPDDYLSIWNQTFDDEMRHRLESEDSSAWRSVTGLLIAIVSIGLLIAIVAVTLCAR